LDKQKEETDMPEGNEKKKDQDGAGVLSSRIAGWALNKIAEDAEGDFGNAEDPLNAVAAYQSSVALHRIADALEELTTIGNELEALQKNLGGLQVTMAKFVDKQ